MAVPLRVKRRWSGATGAPASLKSGELAYNGMDDTLYIGFGDDGGGNATSIKVVAGFGASMMLTTAQTVAGVKTFNDSPLVPTVAPGDSSTKAASTAFVANAITAGSVADGDKGDITVSGSGSSWNIDPDAVTNAKLANMVANTIKGSVAGGDPADLTAAQVKTILALGNVDNTSDANKPVSTATQTALNLKVDSSLIGAASGIVPLGSDSKIASTYLPSYVDDVLEFANLASFPGTGASGVMYAAADTNKIYRWTGSVYVEISGSPGSTDAVTEGVTNLYYTDARVRAAAVAQTITDGVTTSAPSQDAVFDALALKANTASLGSMASQNAGAVNITGGTIDGVTIDGGTF